MNCTERSQGTLSLEHVVPTRRILLLVYDRNALGSALNVCVRVRGQGRQNSVHVAIYNTRTYKDHHCILVFGIRSRKWDVPVPVLNGNGD